LAEKGQASKKATFVLDIKILNRLRVARKAIVVLVPEYHNTASRDP